MLSTDRPIVVTPDGGKRFTVQVRAHHFLVDQPLTEGGQDDGPKPIELLGAALGSCVALYVQEFLRARGYGADGMRIEVMQHAAANPTRVGDFKIRVVLPMHLPPAYGELIERKVATCPAYNTLTYGSYVGVTVEMADGTVFA
jgi:putative redox protein